MEPFHSFCKLKYFTSEASVCISGIKYVFFYGKGFNIPYIDNVYNRNLR